MSRFPGSPVQRRDADLSWAGLAAANVAVLIALIVMAVRAKSLGMF